MLWLLLKCKPTIAGGVITGRSSKEARCSSTSNNPVKDVTCSAVSPGAHAVVKWTISRCWTTSIHYLDIINGDITGITCSFNSFKNNLVKYEITEVWQKFRVNMSYFIPVPQPNWCTYAVWKLAKKFLQEFSSPLVKNLQMDQFITKTCLDIYP